MDRILGVKECPESHASAGGVVDKIKVEHCVLMWWISGLEGKVER